MAYLMVVWMVLLRVRKMAVIQAELTVVMMDDSMAQRLGYLMALRSVAWMGLMMAYSRVDEKAVMTAERKVASKVCMMVARKVVSKVERLALMKVWQLVVY